MRAPVRPADPDDDIRRRNIASYGVDEHRAVELLASMRAAGITEWPPPGPCLEARRARWEAHIAEYGLGPDRVATDYGLITPTTRSPFHPDPARRMTFCTGVGHPHHLKHSPVPLFISAASLIRYRTRYAQQGDDWPVQTLTNEARWAGDCGSYAAIMLQRQQREDHPWMLPPDDYGSMWVRLIEAIGHSSPHCGPDFVAVQDYPCEGGVRAITGLSTDDHQILTTESYVYLCENFPMVPWLPIVQGWELGEHLAHVELYAKYGIDLTGMKVGVGSICRRGSQKDVAAIIRSLAPVGMRMHAFGASINALRLIGHLIDSSDSQAWSATAMKEHIRLPGCTHLSRRDPVTGQRTPTDCRNCFTYAVRYREEALDAVRASAQGAANAPELFELAPTGAPGRRIAPLVPQSLAAPVDVEQLSLLDAMSA